MDKQVGRYGSIRLAHKYVRPAHDAVPSRLCIVFREPDRLTCKKAELDTKIQKSIFRVQDEIHSSSHGGLG